MLIASGTWAFLVVAAMVIASIILLRTLNAPRGLPYCRRPSLLTTAEARFYRTLAKAVDDRMTIFAMVRIADLLVVDSKTANGGGWFNRISCKHVDFVLCDPESLDAVMAIELDDASHGQPDRTERDTFVDAAFRSAGFPLLRIPAQAQYDVGELRATLERQCVFGK